MTRLALLVVAVVIVALRAWARLRRRTSGHEPRRSGLGPFTSDVGLVAAREMRERFRGRVFRVGSLLMLAAVGAAIVIPTLGHGKPQPQSVGVVGALSAPLRATIVASANSAGTAVRFVAEPNESQVDQDLRSGRLDPPLSTVGRWSSTRLLTAARPPLSSLRRSPRSWATTKRSALPICRRRSRRPWPAPGRYLYGACSRSREKRPPLRPRPPRRRSVWSLCS